ncbi:MAG: DUF1800 domain-containing protein [Planctomycetota bacterium]
MSTPKFNPAILAISWACAFAAVVMVNVAAVSAQDRTQDAADSLQGRERIVHLLSRVTFGPTKKLVDEVEKAGLESWLAAQFELPRLDFVTAERLSRFASLGLSSNDVYDKYVLRKEGAPSRRGELSNELTGSVFVRATYNSQQVGEVMSDFWRNHFNVDRSKDSVFWTAVEYDRIVLRDRVFGSFRDMLLASAQHPAMLVYLDNHISRRPPNKTELKSVARKVRRATGSRERGEEAAQIASQRGLNENYARELLELHTLGVDRGYTQKDVIAVAEIFTGWTVDTLENRYTFSFDENMHVHGDKFLLGKTVPRQKLRHGTKEGLLVLDRLARHPLTATFLAEKLCRYLVSDEPPPVLVKTTAAKLRSSDMNLGTAVKHIVASDEFYRPRHYRSKFKTPLEFVISALRVTSANIVKIAALRRTLEGMGQPIYNCEDPTGYRDTAESWRDPGVMVGRWRFALDLVRNRIPGVEVPETLFIHLKNKNRHAMIASLAKEVLPGGMREETLRFCIDASRRYDRIQREKAEAKAMGKKPSKGKKNPKDEKKKRKPLADRFDGIERFLLGVLIGSPEFQEQ